MERLYGQKFKTRREAKDETIAWLLWYNRARLHSALAYISPVQFEQNWLANQPKQANSSSRLWDTDFRGKVKVRLGTNLSSQFCFVCSLANTDVVGPPMRRSVSNLWRRRVRQSGIPALLTDRPKADIYYPLPYCWCLAPLRPQ